jgi:hypothetical protein
MNGMFGNYFPPVPQQNVSNYLRMPVAQQMPKQPQYPTMAQFVSAFNQPQQTDPSLGILQKISGYGTPIQPQPNQANITSSNQDMTGLILQRLAGGFNANR